MSYRTATVASVVDDINRCYFLPAIQRPYVWEPNQIVALFDSLLKGYPISSFLFWDIRPENRRNWEIYKFVEHFRFGDTHNELADPDGREVTLVLDGQQRLTSLIIGLRGSYTVKLKHKRWDSPTGWERRRLYIDLLKDPGTEDQEDREDVGITYGLKFSASEPTSSGRNLWIKVGSILDYGDPDAFFEYKHKLVDDLPDSLTRADQKILEHNLERLHQAVWKDEVIAFYKEKNQSYDRVLDIFIRANDGGTKLSKSDLLLSMITSKWEGVNARDEIYGFVDRLNNDLDRKNALDKDFVMRACLVISDLDHVYKVNNFTSANLATIQKNWPVIKAAVEATIRLVNRFGIDRDTLTSTNALLPIAYYLSKLNGRTLDSSAAFDVENRERIRRWLLGALLNNVFGGNSDQTIGVCRAAVRDALSAGNDFPVDALNLALANRRGRVIVFDENNTAGLLDIRYGQKTCFLGLSVLYDEQNWGATLYHIDHIIPRSLAGKRNLEKLGLAEERVKEIVEAIDRIGNLELLPGRENQEKSNQSFESWIQTRDAGFLARHLIPSDKTLWCVERLPEFVAAREELIRKRLETTRTV
ncbi:MAG TPA: DUF262 domain-containing protein [Candidatus Paceibacterota bacterium]|jgi:uncharacterized protein with ParB-like and HNH nuclease domain|nr:DUF262 domain-containing protein [Candidatus Paceibacterota bacterium]